MKKTTIYVTKYALTKGIKSGEAVISPNGVASLVEDKYNLFHEKDYSFTMEEAKKKANEMKKRKIESLTKNLKKLESMEF